MIELYLRLQKQKPGINTGFTSMADKMISVNSNSAIDNYIIAKVANRDRFVLRPQEYEIFISSAVEDIENKLDDLLKDF